MGVFVPKDQAIEILGAITGAWSDDLRYRVARVKARLKFMIDDIGPRACASASRRGSVDSSRTTHCPR
jgi:ferredoxin-nitrite reductase